MQTLFAVDESLERVRAGLERRIASLGSRVGDHLAEYVGRPGKMLRARYSLLLGASLGVETSISEKVARAVELTHNASLLHDDCIDDALLRRGIPTPNARFGDRTGILLGDLAFTEGMAEAVAISPGAVRSLAATVHEMTIGEIQEEFIKGSPDVSLEGYYGVAARKTGVLFEWAGTVLAENSPLEHRRGEPALLGRSAGILLQIIDDIHDFTLNEEVAGKERGQDFANGRMTLPGILALDNAASRERFLSIWKVRVRGKEALREALALFEEFGHLDRARVLAREIMEGMLPRVDSLPVKEEARRLKEFMKLLFEREF